mmetsp:Transcript_35885/g.86614  ORF Transcript_35885/g.86614 Transcript_35885/m.86614 type:complete len:732 (+) Transcript_35885:159-2354(+)
MSDQEYHPYSQTSDVRFMSQFPRFGHSSDISKLASSDQEEQADYVIGILSVSFFILSVFIFWGISIITCKCMGSGRAGICAGRAQVLSDEKGQFHSPPHIWKFRCLFMPLGCCMILLCMALVGPGLTSVDTMSMSTRKLNRDVKDLITQGLLIMDQVKRVKWNIENLDVESILRVEEACPNLDNKSLKSSIKAVDSEFDNLKQYLEENDLEGIRQQIDRVMEGTEYIETTVTLIEKNDWAVRMFALVLSVLVSFMIFAALTSLCGQCQCLHALMCMTEVFILPTFVLAIVMSLLATSALAFASILNADFCTGNSQQSGPAGTVIGLFEERGIKSDDIIFTAFTYYESGCATEDPILHLYKYEDDLQSGIGSANDFLTKVDEIGIDEISHQCGENVSPIAEGVGLIMSNLGILLGALRSTFELASCMKLSPIYRQAFEGTACSDSSESLALLFLIMLAISGIGMIMIMMRSAMYPYKRVYASSTLDSTLDENEDEWEEYQAYLGYMANFVTMWGGNAAGDDGVCVKTGTYDTSSESASHSHSNSSNSRHRALEISSTISSIEPDEEAPSASPHLSDLDAPSQKLDAMFGEYDEQEPSVFEDEENMPLSPSSSVLLIDTMNNTSERTKLYTPKVKRASECDNEDECTPLSPQTPNIPESERLTRRFKTPDFLSPGTFRRWRQHGKEDITNEEELPETPLMNSPQGQQQLNYFSFNLSPLQNGNREGDRLMKME